MKRLVLVLLIAMLPSTVLAWNEEIECTAGQCEGWRAEYDGDLAKQYPANFVFYNESGLDAFNIKIHVNFYDYFGDYLGRAEVKAEGPIHQRLTQAINPPQGAEKASFEIYWKDTCEN